MSGWVFDFKNWIKSNNFVFIIHSYRWKIELDFLGKRLESIFEIVDWIFDYIL